MAPGQTAGILTQVEVRVLELEPSRTAVVRATTSWPEFATQWRPMLDEVWRFLRRGGAGVAKHGLNVMLYLDDAPTVEVGVQVDRDFEPSGSVVPSGLPGGLAATARHTGPMSRIGDTHDSVVRWCAEHGHALTGVRWEIYGDPDPSTGHFDVEVFWALASEVARGRDSSPFNVSRYVMLS